MRITDGLKITKEVTENEIQDPRGRTNLATVGMIQWR